MVWTKVLLIDDQPKRRQEVRALLSSSGGLKVVEEAAEIGAAATGVEDLGADLVIAGSFGPESVASNVARKIKRKRRSAKLLVLSDTDGIEVGLSALKAGADGYLLREKAASELLSAVAALGRGESYLSASLADALIRECRQGRRDRSYGLTERQRRIVKLVVDGNTSPRIAEIMGFGVDTIKSERRAIMRKLGVRNLIGLVKFGLRHSQLIEDGAA